MSIEPPFSPHHAPEKRGGGVEDEDEAVGGMLGADSKGLEVAAELSSVYSSR
ncbi:MAG: hypothetical protein ACRD1R_16335 [Acidobacteriota bacterium]